MWGDGVDIALYYIYTHVYPQTLSTTVGIVGMKGTGVNIGKYCGLMPQGVTLVVVET